MKAEVEIVKLKPVALNWRLAVIFIGMTGELPSKKREELNLYEKFRRWTRARGIMPDESGLYSVKKLQQEFAG